MLHKIKTLKEIIEPKASRLGISFEESLENINEHTRFGYLMREYKRKLNPEKYEGMNFISNIIRLTGDCKSIKTYLKKEYLINDSKYYDQFIDYLSEIASTRPESIMYWRSTGMLSNKEDLIDKYSSHEPYRQLRFKDISLLLKTLNLKPLYHLNDSEFSSLINDKEYKNWLCSPVEKGDGTVYPWNRLNLEFSTSIFEIYKLYIKYIVEKWITDNVDPNSEIAKKCRSTYGSYKWTGPIINQIIFDNPTYFKRKDNMHSSYINPYADYMYDIDYSVSVPSDNLELSILIEHFAEFKTLMNQLFTDEKIEALYCEVAELDKKQSIKPETTLDRAIEYAKSKGNHGVVYGIDADDNTRKYLSLLQSCSMLEYYVNNPDELIIYKTLEYPNSQKIPCTYDLNQILNEKSYWSKSLQKWDKVKYDELVKKTKTKIKKVDKILENYNAAIIKNQVNCS